MKFTILFPNDNNATTKGAYFSSSSTTPSATKTALKKQPSRVAKVSYCNTSDSELENDEDGYEFKKKAKAKNAIDSDSNSIKFELGSDADDWDEAIAYDTVFLEMESEDDEMIGLKRKKNSNVVSLTHTVGTSVGVMFCCNVGFRFRMKDTTIDGNDSCMP